jgi:hypothetical protein
MLEVAKNRELLLRFSKNGKSKKHSPNCRKFAQFGYPGCQPLVMPGK